MSETPALHCLGGAAPPAELQAELRTWLALPKRARGAYWELLRPNLAPEVDERITAAVQQLLKKYELSGAQLAPSIKACRLMMREAARLDVSPEQFDDDAETLADDEPELKEGMKTWYRAAYPLLRHQIVMATIQEHSNLATGLDWRVDMITRSHHGRGIDTPVAVFSFRYRDGTEEKRFTLQFLPEQLDQIRSACNEILADS